MGSVTQLRKNNPQARRDEMAETAYKAIERGGRCYKGNPGNIDLTLRLSFEEKAAPNAPHDITKLFGKVCGKLGLYGEVSFSQVEDADNTYGTKLGAKFSF